MTGLQDWRVYFQTQKANYFIEKDDLRKLDYGSLVDFEHTLNAIKADVRTAIEEGNFL